MRIMMSNGSVVGFGYNSHGQLGVYLPVTWAVPSPKGSRRSRGGAEAEEAKEWVGGTVREAALLVVQLAASER